MKILALGRDKASLLFFGFLAAFFILTLSSCYKPQPLSLPSSDITSYKDMDGPAEALSKPEIPKLVLAGEDDAVKKALENNERVKLLGQDVDIASSALESAGKIDNPELRVSDLTTRDMDEGRLREIEVGLRWQSPKLGELSAEKDAAKAEVGLARVEQELYKQKLCREVRKIYVEIAALQKLMEIYDKKIELNSSKVSVIESQLALGERTSLELTEARLDLFDAQDERDRIVQELNAQKALLESFIGAPIEIQAFEIEEKPLNETVEQFISVAYKNRLEFDEVFYQHQRAQADYYLEKAEVIPWFSFIELTYHGEDDPNDPPEHWGELRFGFDLPIFNLNNGNIRAKKQKIERAKSKLELTKGAVEKQVSDAYVAYKDLLAEMDAYKKETAGLISSAEKVIDDAKTSGLVDPLRIVRVQLQVLDVKESLVKKQRRLALARIELFSAAGIILDR